jgi:hypothetical protein
VWRAGRARRLRKWSTEDEGLSSQVPGHETPHACACVGLSITPDDAGLGVAIRATGRPRAGRNGAILRTALGRRLRAVPTRLA